MSYERNSLESLLLEFGEALLRLTDFETTAELTAFLEQIGWNNPGVQVPALNQTLIQNVENAIDSVAPDSVESLSASEITLRYGTLIVAVTALIDHIYNWGQGIASDIPRKLLDYLVLEHVYDLNNSLFELLRLLGIFIADSEYDEESLDEILTGHKVNYDRLLTLISDPKNYLIDLYGWATQNDKFDLLIENINYLFITIGLQAALEYPSFEIAQSLAQPVPLLEDGTNIDGEDPLVRVPLIDSDLLNFGFTVGVVPAINPAQGRGIAITLYATDMIQVGFPLDDLEEWLLSVETALDLKSEIGIVIRPQQGIRVIDNLADTPQQPTGKLRAKISYQPIDGITIIKISDALEISAELSYLQLYAEAKNISNPEIVISCGLEKGKLYVGGETVDSFLRSQLPESGLEIGFDFGIGWSTKRGFHITGDVGNAKLEFMITLHEEIGPLKLSNMYFTLIPSSDNIKFLISTSGSVSLGPLNASIDRLGVKCDANLLQSGNGNLGPVDLSLGFKPPTGIGLSIDGGGFKGGGFLYFDHDNKRYAGVLELEFKDTIALKAIGLLTTKMPDGSDGFSLLIIITAEFTSIQLGFGFSLVGVGGLLGLNRTAKIERLRTGVRDNTLSSILFPQNVVANANRIISDLRQVFPPLVDRFIFGPMAKLGWGVPSLLIIDLGLLIEIPDPIRIAILGIIKAVIPDENYRILRLQVNFLGVIDFEKKMLSFDASIYASKLLTFTLSGDMALRISWGADPNFLLTVGGFHPAYQPPPLALPVIRRLTLQLLGGKNPRLTLETYFAVTSNTVQFGAKIELYAAAGPFSVFGFLAFDVLFQFNPFYFIASIGAMLALRVGSWSIASIKLALSLEGPTPWRAKGTATLTLFWFLKIKVRFNKTFGEERDTRLDDVAVLPLLKTALGNTGNWQAQLPAGRNLLVNLKKIETTGDEVVTHPFGVITIGQKVVPLKLKIDKFGNQLPSDSKKFSIDKVQVVDPVPGGSREDLNTSDVKEYFAPAQFFERTNSQKLSSKSYEKYINGVKLVGTEEFDSDYATKRDIKYELFYIDEQRNLNLWLELVELDGLAFQSWSIAGAIANSPLSYTGKMKSALAPDEVTVDQENYAVVNVSDLNLVNEQSAVTSEAEAYNLMDDLISENPSLLGDIQVVPIFEVNKS